MDLSVIIVCYKGWDRLNRCLESLDSFSGKSFTMEVIVVNNNPGDDAFVEIENRFTKFMFIQNAVNGGYSNGCNLGAANAAGNYLLILNPDTVAREEEIRKLLQAAKSDPSSFIISCRQVRENGKESKAMGSFPWQKKETSGREPGSNGRKNREKNIIFPDWVSGSIMMIQKEIFDSLKGFDEDFWMYYEDVDLCRRARNAGGKIAFCNDITVEHNHGGSTRADLRTTSVSKCEVQISKHLYFKKHETGIKRVLIQAITVADNLITGIVTGLTGLVFFFIPKLFVRFLVFLRVTGYYTGSLFRKSWISPRSVNFRNKDLS
jgi:GT2 family glycosyltransferase